MSSSNDSVNLMQTISAYPLLPHHPAYKKFLDVCWYLLCISALSLSTLGFAQAQTLNLTKTADKTTVRPGDTLTFTLTLTNSGASSAADVKVKDLISNELTFISATPSQGTYDAQTGIWDLGTVAVGSQTLTIVVRVR